MQSVLTIQQHALNIKRQWGRMLAPPLAALHHFDQPLDVRWAQSSVVRVELQRPRRTLWRYNHLRPSGLCQIQVSQRLHVITPEVKGTELLTQWGRQELRLHSSHQGATD
jgi:hypothetical protein